MINFVYGKVKKLASWKGIIILTLLFFISLTIINGKPLGVAKLKEYTGGVGILDLERSYTPEQAYRILESQGEIGRQFYKRIIILLDFVFPTIYMIFWSVVINFLFTKWLMAENKMHKFCLVPLLAGLSDYIENILILTMIHYFPKKLYNIAIMANAMTILKGIFTGVSILLIIAGLVGLIQKKITKKKKLDV